jgi:hypothetical protein
MNLLLEELHHVGVERQRRAHLGIVMPSTVTVKMSAAAASHSVRGEESGPLRLAPVAVTRCTESA